MLCFAPLSQDITGLLKGNIDDLEHYHQGLYLGFNHLRRMTGALADAWEGRNAPELLYLDIATPRTMVRCGCLGWCRVHSNV